MTGTKLDGHVKPTRRTHTTRYQVGPNLLKHYYCGVVSHGPTLNLQPFTLRYLGSTRRFLNRDCDSQNKNIVIDLWVILQRKKQREVQDQRSNVPNVTMHLS